MKLKISKVSEVVDRSLLTRFQQAVTPRLNQYRGKSTIDLDLGLGDLINEPGKSDVVISSISGVLLRGSYEIRVVMTSQSRRNLSDYTRVVDSLISTYLGDMIQSVGENLGLDLFVSPMATSTRVMNDGRTGEAKISVTLTLV